MTERRLEGTLNGTAAASTAHANGHSVASKVESQAARCTTSGRQIRAGRASSAPTRAADVIRLRGSVQEEHTLARLGAERLWSLLNERRTTSTRSAR